MGSVAEGRLQEVMAVWRRWDRYSGKFDAMAKRRSKQALHELAVYCEPEITEALNAYKKGSHLVLFDVAGTVYELAHVAVLEAAQTLRDVPNRQFLSHVKYCAIEVLRETESEQQKWQSAAPKQLLDMMLLLSRSDAASILTRLPFDQRNDLLVESLRRMSVDKEQARSVGQTREAEDDLLWLVGYVGHLHVEEPAVKDLLTKSCGGTTVIRIGSAEKVGSQPTNKCGEPINLAGPALVKVFEALTGLPNNSIPAEASSKSKLGCSFGVSRKVIARWRDHLEWKELRAETVPDGEGGLYYVVDRENELRSARIAGGKKRGPKDKELPKNTL